jgi:hypothetical protein
MFSNEVRKFLKFPIKAIPEGPMKIAKTFEVINPIPILSITLMLFKEVTLNKGVFAMRFIEFKC